MHSAAASVPAIRGNRLDSTASSGNATSPTATDSDDQGFTLEGYSPVCRDKKVEAMIYWSPFYFI
jgi:hypothetical protein